MIQLPLVEVPDIRHGPLQLYNDVLPFLHEAEQKQLRPSEL